MEKGLHVGIILDGNRRWAKARGMMPWVGHSKGAEKLEQLFDWCKELGINQVTLYCFSMQNFQRSSAEVKFLFQVFKRSFDKLLKNIEKTRKDDIRIRFIGRTHLFPASIKERMDKIMELTRDHKTYTANFCMAYGGREEITDAMKKIAVLVENGDLAPEEITEETIKENLWLQDEPDFIIRTSGEQRTSNFLPWQGNYSEWFFPKKMWPEFEKEDLSTCVNEFLEQRQRRFGK
ncbi:di-trans,poly-cis-decaprenylcistransferase [Candidatus Woesearchaeota archaeon]|nr:di-trans,poly-cis-decaprenylcistransferase [Candidatus Woesearchaeota archaeon]